MVRWYHAIFSAYGFWLPNDPRGSWSDFVRSWELFYVAGPATKTIERRSLARDAHDEKLRREAKEHLQCPPVRFDPAQRAGIASGIEQACVESNIVVHACAIGYDHVHVVTQRHPIKSIEEVVTHFKSRATKQMTSRQVHPLAGFVDTRGSTPSPWSRHGWNVFIEDLAQLRSAINYVERHPMKEGLPAQHWSFVTPV